MSDLRGAHFEPEHWEAPLVKTNNCSPLRYTLLVLSNIAETQMKVDLLQGKLFVPAALLRRERNDLAKEAVRLLVRPGGEKQLDRRSRGAVASEVQPPQAIND